jgi:uncharacterized pyridoxal phosphate-containing UPF0001 family protein
MNASTADAGTGIPDARNPPGGALPSSEDPSPGATDGATALRSRHDAVRDRIAAAARAHGRAPDGVVLLAVSKTFDADAVLALAACGQRDFGENYLQEALPKMAAVRDRWPTAASGRSDPADPRAAAPADGPLWHFIGPIQSNKTRPIAEGFDWVHSVDRDKVARRLSEQRPEGAPPLQVCIQVDVSGEATKSGCDPDEAVELGRLVATLPRLRLRGVMAIPAPLDEPAAQRAQFARVRAVYERMRDAGLPVDTLSMGMSGDLEAAVAEGATIVRVGTALFGERAGKRAL